MAEEDDLIEALGMTDLSDRRYDDHGGDEGQEVTPDTYEVVPHPTSEQVDLSELRGVKSSGDDKAGGGGTGKNGKPKKSNNDDNELELEGLAEIVPDIKHRRRLGSNEEGQDFEDAQQQQPPPDEDENEESKTKPSLQSASDSVRVGSLSRPANRGQTASLKVQESGHLDDSGDLSGGGGGGSGHQQAAAHKTGGGADAYPARINNEHGGAGASSHGSRHGGGGDSLDDYPDSDLVIEEEGQEVGEPEKVPKEYLNMNMSAAQSMSTATQTHEVRMPMYLPTFKPATGCTNASDFIVRCFVARLRSGITVVKHGRSRWCKSRLRVMHIHPDGRSLSWKPAEGEPASSRRPPKLDLSTCLEVRHAWSPDPQNPMYTGTQILRQKCEAANAHKSFALIFKTRTVDITAVTADQCKVLMEGFSALCFRLQVANLAGRSGGNSNKKGAVPRPMPEEDGVSTTASATLTNTSTPRAR